MYFLKLIQLLFLVHVSICQRRIQNGVPLPPNADKRYVVYFLKSVTSTQYYEGWICGGALVTNEFIITSAACVTDVIHLFAIAGYRKYINDLNIENDECTKEMKKKVVLICTPQAYEFRYEELTKWSNIDIAVVKVESPFDFEDKRFETLCSYLPTTIPINNEEKYQNPGIDALVFGWGHKERWRTPDDNNDYNEETLMYSPVLMEEKEKCVEQYKDDYPGMVDVINRYMICSAEIVEGNIDAEGEVIKKSPPDAEGCTMPGSVRMGSKCKRNPDSEEEIVLIDSGRRTDEFQMNENGTVSNVKAGANITQYKDVYPRRATRRNGICQNDHGGPLVTWVGSHEVLIGVSSVFKINADNQCIGPFLFTSTQCNGAFLNCVIVAEGPSVELTRKMCEKPARERGFDIITKHVSWHHHPAGPADNERNASITSSNDLDKFSDVTYVLELNVHSNTTSYEINTILKKDKSNASVVDNPTDKNQSIGNLTKSTIVKEAQTSIVNKANVTSINVTDLNDSTNLSNTSQLLTDIRIPISIKEIISNSNNLEKDSTILDLIGLNNVSNVPVPTKYISDKNRTEVITSTIDVNNTNGGVDLINNSTVNIITNSIFRTNATAIDPVEMTNTSTYNYSTTSTASNLNKTVVNIIQNVTLNIIKNILIFPTNDTKPIISEETSESNKINDTTQNTFSKKEIQSTIVKPFNKTDEKFDIKDPDLVKNITTSDSLSTVQN